MVHFKVLAGKTLLWLEYALHELRLEQAKPVVLFTDSANARTTILNPLNSARTRHIDIRYRWVIDQVAKGHFEVHHVGTGKMIADGLTKQSAFLSYIASDDVSFSETTSPALHRLFLYRNPVLENILRKLTSARQIRTPQGGAAVVCDRNRPVVCGREARHVQHFLFLLVRFLCVSVLQIPCLRQTDS